MKSAEEWTENIIWNRLNSHELAQMIRAVQQDARAELLERIKELEELKELVRIYVVSSSSSPKVKQAYDNIEAWCKLNNNYAT